MHNLQFLKNMPDGLVDLVYIDPPFFTQRDFLSKKGKTQFQDKWDSLEDFVTYIIKRCVEIHRVLKETGIFCIHVDYRTVHYLKVELDKIFGYENFINEIIWSYKSGGAGKKRFSNKHDTILVYSKSNNYTFNIQKEKSYNRGLSKYGYVKEKPIPEFKDNIGWHTIINMKDIWKIHTLGTCNNERNGYATQKPLKLLLRIIKSFSNPGDLVADFFVGSGTTLIAAHHLKRHWLGVDNSDEAIKTMRKRFLQEINLDINIL